jgi:hypothetical protein
MATDDWESEKQVYGAYTQSLMKPGFSLIQIGSSQHKRRPLFPLKGAPDDPSAWFYTFARNRPIDRQRHQTRFPTDNEIPDIQDVLNDKGEFPFPFRYLKLTCWLNAVLQYWRLSMLLIRMIGLSRVMTSAMRLFIWQACQQS